MLLSNSKESPAFRRGESQLVIGSLKGEVNQAKHNSVGWIFSCFAAPLNEQDLFCRVTKVYDNPSGSPRPSARMAVLQNDLTNILSVP